MKTYIFALAALALVQGSFLKTVRAQEACTAELRFDGRFHATPAAVEIVTNALEQKGYRVVDRGSISTIVVSGAYDLSADGWGILYKSIVIQKEQPSWFILEQVAPTTFEISRGRISRSGVETLRWTLAQLPTCRDFNSMVPDGVVYPSQLRCKVTAISEARSDLACAYYHRNLWNSETDRVRAESLRVATALCLSKDLRLKDFQEGEVEGSRSGYEWRGGGGLPIPGAGLLPTRVQGLATAKSALVCGN